MLLRVFFPHSVSCFNIGRRGTHRLARLCMNRFIRIMSTLNDLRSFRFFGLSLSVMAWNFSSIGLMPSADNMYSSHSVLFFAMWSFSTFSLTPASSRTFTVSSTFVICSSFVLFVKMRMSQFPGVALFVHMRIAYLEM